MARGDRTDRTWLRSAGIGFELAGAIAGFVFLGYLVDRAYDTSPWGILVGLVLGLVGGMYNSVREALAASRRAREGRPQEPRERADRPG